MERVREMVEDFMRHYGRVLAVAVVMSGTLFAAHEALAAVVTGTAEDDALIGTDLDDHLGGRAGMTTSRAIPVTTTLAAV